MLNEVETKNIRGCQLLDYFSKVNCGIPVVLEVVERYTQEVLYYKLILSILIIIISQYIIVSFFMLNHFKYK